MAFPAFQLAAAENHCPTFQLVCQALHVMRISRSRRGGRVVERGGLENRYTFTGIGGSNPPLSAILKFGMHISFSSLKTMEVFGFKKPEFRW